MTPQEAMKPSTDAYITAQQRFLAALTHGDWERAEELRFKCLVSYEAWLDAATAVCRNEVHATR